MPAQQKPEGARQGPAHRRCPFCGAAPERLALEADGLAAHIRCKGCCGHGPTITIADEVARVCGLERAAWHAWNNRRVVAPEQKPKEGG